MKQLRVDRERAIRVAAMLGLLAIAASVLPGLLRVPDPPDLPPDVGFLPSDRSSAASLPAPSGRSEDSGSKYGKRRQHYLTASWRLKRSKASDRRARNAQNRLRKAKGGNRRASNRPGSRGSGPVAAGSTNSPGSPAASGSTGSPGASAAARPATSVVAPVAAAASPAGLASPSTGAAVPTNQSSPGSSPRMPTDGSQEFAPR
jgi:hypothetical protein